MNTTTYGINGYGTFFEPCVLLTGESWNSVKELHTIRSQWINNDEKLTKHNHSILRGLSFVKDDKKVTTTIDLYRFLFKKMDIDVEEYNEFISALKNSHSLDNITIKISKFTYYDREVKKVSEYKYQVDNCWITELDALKIIRG